MQKFRCIHPITVARGKWLGCPINWALIGDYHEFPKNCAGDGRPTPSPGTTSKEEWCEWLGDEG
jgi:hypothetical protein